MGDARAAVRRLSCPSLLLSILLFGLGSSLAAQSITNGSLQGTVRASGEPLSGAAVTIEDQSGGVVRELTTRTNGSFSLSMMLPGSYNVLVELPGYQPVRLRGVIVASGRTTSVSADLVERPPPITSVTEIAESGTSTGPIGRVAGERELRTLEFRREVTDLSRSLSEVVAPVDGRTGFALGASGLQNRMIRAYADGIPEILLRHPGMPGDPASLTAFQREAIGQAQIAGGALDPEWRGNPGSSLAVMTRTGSNRMEFSPYFAGSSAKLGGNSLQNPADSNGTSFLGGLTVRGPIKRDTAQFFLQGGFQSVQTPSPYPWEDVAGATAEAPLRDAVQQVALDRYSTNIAASVLPTVRTWKGGAGLGRLDWNVGRNSRVMFRAGGGSFKETNPILGHDVGNDAGASLSGRDISAAASLTTMASFANELRLGLSMARRDWKGSGLPETRLAAEGVRFGGNAALPALFESQLLSFSDAAQYQYGVHSLKAGLSVDVETFKQTYDYGSSGRFVYADLDRFNSGIGASFRSTAAFGEAKITAPLIGLFFQDTWSISPGFDLLLGLRYETQILPKNQIVANGNWVNQSGLAVDSTLRYRKGIQPRAGFQLRSASGWAVQGGVGLASTGMDLSQFAEVVHNSGENVRVLRQVGAVSWLQPATSGAVTRLSVFGLPGQYRQPRTLKGDLALGRSFGGLAFRISGSYHHTDYLLRRNDLNLTPFPFGTAQDGRPVYGALVKQGGLVVSAPGSSRRFTNFDLVTALTPTGFSDHYEATVSLSRPISGSFAVSAEYTYSRTRDNLVGLLQPDAADQLSPFPGGINGQDWDEGRSDLDVPHRAAAALEFRSGGRNPISLALRGRFRSGLPFTPGFRSGVDLNGDLGGNNDPAAIDAVTSPSGSNVFASCERTQVAGFAARNSCREKAVGSLDAQLGVPLPLGNGPGRLLLTVEAFNLIASTTGVVDRAALLVDPQGTLTMNPTTGAVQIPFAANPGFGTLLRRGGEPRIIRLGLRMEY